MVVFRWPPGRGGFSRRREYPPRMECNLGYSPYCRDSTQHRADEIEATPTGAPTTRRSSKTRTARRCLLTPWPPPMQSRNPLKANQPRSPPLRRRALRIACIRTTVPVYHGLYPDSVDTLIRCGIVRWIVVDCFLESLFPHDAELGFRPLAPEEAVGVSPRATLAAPSKAPPPLPEAASPQEYRLLQPGSG